MLTLEQYGVKLIRLDVEDIELVRHWRNQSDIANYMEYRNYITPEAQVKWFESINNKFNYYFIIEFEGNKIGLINSKNYSSTEGFGEGGIFIWDKAYENSFAAAFASLCLLNWVFFDLKLCDRSRARILRTNDRAIYYNKLIGYKILPGQEEVENQLYELHIEDYKHNAIKLNSAAAALSPGKEKLICSGKISDKNLPEINAFLEKQNL